MNFLNNISYRYKLFFSLLLTVMILGVFYYQNYALSHFIDEQIISIHKKDVQLNKTIQQISKNLDTTTSHYIASALQKNLTQEDTKKTQQELNHLKELINKLEKNDDFNDKSIKTSLLQFKKRLIGYSGILFDLPEAYLDSSEDAIYSIMSLNAVKEKMNAELNTLSELSQKNVENKMQSMQNIVRENSKQLIMISILSLSILFIFNFFMIRQMLHAIAILEDENKSFFQFLTSKIDNISIPKEFSKDEMGQILKLVSKNIQQAQTLITNERGMAKYVQELSKTLEQRVESGLVEIKALNKEIEETQREVIFTMGSIGESRSKETGNHVKRVAEYSKLLAILYGIDEAEANLIKEASPMHDIGKVAIADSILNKPGKLTNEEFDEMKKHAQIGYEMLKHSNRPILKTAAIIAYQHHEKYNGKGYPRGLKGDEVHIYGYITAIADVFDALGSDRVYKKAWNLERIINLFKEERGEHFHPELTDLFLDNLDKFLEIRNTFVDKIPIEA